MSTCDDRSSAERLAEAFDDLWSRLVDPVDAIDDDGAAWLRLGGGSSGGASGETPFATETELAALRAECRMLAATNEFAINGHENRISYVVGTGHTYRAVARNEKEVDDVLVHEVQAVLDEFVRVNHWHSRQQEIVRRRDRDGEAFLRLFAGDDGIARVRFVEPAQVRVPVAEAHDPAASFGIRTAPEDVETVLAYCIDGRWIDAADVQHRKANVDRNMKRGLPLFFPVRKNLRRAEKLLRNMSVLAEIQSAIALIRKHTAGTRASVQRFVDAAADATTTSAASGRTTHFRRYAPGTILDAFAGTEYEFPTIGLDVSRYVAVLGAELRAIAARLVMPEFMLTSDASNANYASTMIAEGPAVRMFQRLQQEMVEDDVELLDRVIAGAVRAGRLPHEAIDRVAIQGFPPSLAVRDRLKETEADEILLRCGAMSRETMARRHGLDPEKEFALSLAQAFTPGT
ncbi:MAG TPA: phage portal protein [Thermoguttaceae bacterium]|nr:phage portal protein [Thermoguttaceae bacterium]